MDFTKDIKANEPLIHSYKNSNDYIDDNMNESEDEDIKPTTLHLAVNLSWLVNWFLFAAKIVAVILSGSKAVAASLADSAVDLVSQGVLALAENYMSKHHPDYPVGRSRLEALSVIGCAFIMTVASIEGNNLIYTYYINFIFLLSIYILVVQYSCIDIYNGMNGDIPDLNVSFDLYIILGVGVVLKCLLFFYCSFIQKSLTTGKDMVEALAEDHLNDVLSNSIALLTASLAFYLPNSWWVDPAGAILISVVIIYRWCSIINEQIKKIVGHTAPQSFIDSIEELAHEHDERLKVDCTRVYFFGARYNVEMEVVLPGNMTVRESHDIALELQHKIEKIEEVERCFIHVDHDFRDGLEHKVERELVKNTYNDSELRSRKNNNINSTQKFCEA